MSNNIVLPRPINLDDADTNNAINSALYQFDEHKTKFPFLFDKYKYSAAELAMNWFLVVGTPAIAIALLTMSLIQLSRNKDKYAVAKKLSDEGLAIYYRQNNWDMTNQAFGFNSKLSDSNKNLNQVITMLKSESSSPLNYTGDSTNSLFSIKFVNISTNPTEYNQAFTKLKDSHWTHLPFFYANSIDTGSKFNTFYTKMTEHFKNPDWKKSDKTSADVQISETNSVLSGIQQLFFENWQNYKTNPFDSKQEIISPSDANDAKLPTWVYKEMPHLWTTYLYPNLTTSGTVTNFNSFLQVYSKYLSQPVDTYVNEIINFLKDQEQYKTANFTEIKTQLTVNVQQARIRSNLTNLVTPVDPSFSSLNTTNEVTARQNFGDSLDCFYKLLDYLPIVSNSPLTNYHQTGITPALMTIFNACQLNPANPSLPSVFPNAEDALFSPYAIIPSTNSFNVVSGMYSWLAGATGSLSEWSTFTNAQQGFLQYITPIASYNQFVSTPFNSTTNFPTWINNQPLYASSIFTAVLYLGVIIFKPVLKSRRRKGKSTPAAVIKLPKWMRRKTGYDKDFIKWGK